MSTTTHKVRIATPEGNATLTLQDDGVVWAMTTLQGHGGWRVERFNGGTFGAEWARQWAAARFPASPYVATDGE